MLRRWSRICWKGSMFWKACNKQNTWEWWMCMGCNQQRSATDSARAGSWSGDSKNYCVWGFDVGWNVSGQNLFHGCCCQSRRNIMLQLLMTIQTATKEPDFLQKVIAGDEWWAYGYDPWSGNEGPVVPVEVTWSSMPEESMAKSQQDQDHINCVFWLGRCCPSWVHPAKPNN